MEKFLIKEKKLMDLKEDCQQGMAKSFCSITYFRSISKQSTSTVLQGF